MQSQIFSSHPFFCIQRSLGAGRAHKLECARLRCMKRSCEHRSPEEKLRLREVADPLEDISADDRDHGDSGSLEEAAGFFDEHESDEEVLVPKGERDYLNLTMISRFWQGCFFSCRDLSTFIAGGKTAWCQDTYTIYLVPGYSCGRGRGRKISTLACSVSLAKLIPWNQSASWPLQRTQQLTLQRVNVAGKLTSSLTGRPTMPSPMERKLPTPCGRQSTFPSSLRQAKEANGRS